MASQTAQARENRAASGRRPDTRRRPPATWGGLGTGGLSILPLSGRRGRWSGPWLGRYERGPVRTVRFNDHARRSSH